MTSFVSIQQVRANGIGHEWAAISDSMITVRDLKEWAEPNRVPSLYGLPADEFRSRTKRLLSKCIVRSDYCIHWAGDVALAKAACSWLIHVKPRRPDQFRDCMERFGGPKADLQIMCSFIEGDEIFSLTMKCDRVERGGFDFLGGGTGFKFTLPEAEETQDSLKYGLDLQGDDALQVALSRIGHFLDIERSNPSSAFDDFGAAWEIVVCEDGCFCRKAFSVSEIQCHPRDVEKRLTLDRYFLCRPLSFGSSCIVANFERADDNLSSFANFYIGEITEHEIDEKDFKSSVFSADLGVLKIISGGDRATLVGSNPVFAEGAIEGDNINFRYSFNSELVQAFLDGIDEGF